MSHSQGPTNRPSSFSNYVLADRSVTKIDGEGPFYVVVNLLAVAVYITSPTTNASCASCSGSMHETFHFVLLQRASHQFIAASCQVQALPSNDEDEL